MIIFFNKKTGEMVGTVSGRVHTEHQLTKVFIAPEGMKKSDIKKYVVPVKPKYGIRDKKKVVLELLPDGVLGELVRSVEKGKKNLYDYKLKVSKDGKIKGVRLVRKDKKK
jgi:hypothetical protein